MQLQTDECSKWNKEHAETVIDYNLGFAPKIWKQWLELLKLSPMKPIVDAITDAEPANNFLSKHPKLKQSEVMSVAIIFADLVFAI